MEARSPATRAIPTRLDVGCSIRCRTRPLPRSRRTHLPRVQPYVEGLLRCVQRPLPPLATLADTAHSCINSRHCFGRPFEYVHSALLHLSQPWASASPDIPRSLSNQPEQSYSLGMVSTAGDSAHSSTLRRLAALSPTAMRGPCVAALRKTTRNAAVRR